ncbi:TlpA family protein disulfide reductase [Achromobacter sp. ACM01]|uniref:TlpA disulfide reductase family protein n=1 Tax=Achromobacter sp. ACM01 TaxID=2769298 RepID=UPI00177A9111|nr:TlpA disulfide reductase family protein [Achromobacter sp. ACM01]MBD9473640.1 TlpA family protein disulfide reductase [Achromobacter sp. ACM01]
MIGIGPFSIQSMGVFAAVLFSWLVTRALAKRLPDASHRLAGAVLLDGVFWGIVAARLGYIAFWWEDYFAAPMALIAIGDGGYYWWVGVPATLAFIWWRTRTMPAPRRPIYAGILVGVVAWFAGGALLPLLLEPPRLPDLQLQTLDGKPIALRSYEGKPLVVNLWASWCPPCRREMPALEQAQSEFPGVSIVLVNQGEGAQQAHDFIQSEGLALRNVLLDPASASMRAVNSRGLPTTLFYDAQGRLVDTHLGEITMAALKDKMSRRFDIPRDGIQDLPK